MASDVRSRPCSYVKKEHYENIINDQMLGAERTKQGHPTRNFDEISVRESLLVLKLSDNALTKSDWFFN